VAETTKVKVRIFADKSKKRWFGAFAYAKAKEIKSNPTTYQIIETIDDEAEFLKGAKVHCITDYFGDEVAAWKA
jgi:hypothetical protein